MNEKGKATLTYGEGKTVDLPMYGGSHGPDVIDIRHLYSEGGVFTFDPGYTSTGSCESAITYMQQTYGTGRTALVGHSMGGRLASLYPQRRGGITALALWSPANGAGLRGMEFLNIDDFSAVEALAAEAEASGSISTWGVDVSGTLFTEMRDSDPNAALRESALPTLLTYTGHEGILSDTTQAETIAAVESRSLQTSISHDA